MPISPAFSRRSIARSTPRAWSRGVDVGLRDAVRRALRRWGYSVYRSKSLPVGLDLVADISRIKDFAGMRVVFDVGANVGDGTLDPLPHAPAATFYCFEPSADTFATLTTAMSSRSQ